MFKVGQKVVFIGLPSKRQDPHDILPKIGEVVTVHSPCESWDGFYMIAEYLYDRAWMYQAFASECFRPLDEVSRELTEEILESIKEPQLV